MAFALGRLSFDKGIMQLYFRAEHVTCALDLGHYTAQNLCRICDCCTSKKSLIVLYCAEACGKINLIFSSL